MTQSSYVMPVSGLVTMATFADDINGGFNALASRSSGNSAPANGPSAAATQLQDWGDTTAPTLIKMKMFDGVNWPRWGTLDTTNSLWLPTMGGGNGTIAS